MYIQTGQVFKWRQRKRKGNIVSILNRYLVMMPLVLISTAGIALAEPTGGVITGGSGTITQAESATNINQASPRLDINWQTFSTEVHESVNFTQPTADALAINRVIGGVPSELRGALNANGRVVILNDSGITFFGTSQVNVGALLATTATNLSTDGDRLSFSGAGYGEVLNEGSIHVSDGGFAVLAAPYVSNTGFIQANLGTIQLASANDFTVDFRGDGLIGFTVSKSTLDGIVEAGKALGVDNTGTLLAGSGAIGISAGAASSIVQSVVNLEGVVDASSFGAGTGGGTVLVTSVGDINIGGEVHADGGVSGNGGTVTTWADGTNVFASGAVITARGGDIAGDGGLIEVSGNDVRVRGTVNASAPNGAAGTFLIDPVSNLTIADGAGTDSTATVFEQNIENTSGGGTNVSLVANNSITMQDLTTDGVLQGGDGAISMSISDPGCSDCAITFADPNDKIATTGGAITMTAPDGTGGPGLGTIDIGHLETTGAYANITLTAGGGGISAGNLTTGGLGLGIANPGDISLTTTNGGDIAAPYISIIAEGDSYANASLDIDAAGIINVGSVLVKADASSEGSAYAYANANLVAGDDITVTGGIEVAANAFGSSGDTASADAHATLTAGNNVTVNNGITVQAVASNTLGSDVDADADLYVTASEGDINITGDMLVKADATLGVNGSSSASASATADLYAGGSVEIIGGITVEAIAVHNGSEYDADAYAYLYVTAEGGDIKITGDMLVKADATLENGTYYASASATAYADLYAGNNMTINGDVTVQATALNNSVNGSDASASAELYMTAEGGETGGDLEVNGNILVKADATNNGTDSASASAYADLYAGRDVTVNGNITVEAVASNTFGSSEVDADADLDVTASGGDINITGDMLVKADATLGVNGSSSASASATADLYAGGSVNIIGGITVEATAVHNGTEYSADADANLYVTASEGDINIAGDITVTASATMGVNGTDSASASATADLYAATNININGDITVTANAENNGSGSATASAYLYAIAGNDLGINGDITVTADAAVGSGGYYYSPASATAVALLTGGNDVNITTGSGTINVAANAVNNGSGSATAGAVLVAAAGVDGNELIGLAYGIVNGYVDPTDDVSYLFGSGDLNITGDIKVTALADSASSSANAIAAAIMAAANDATILTDPITVRSEANTGAVYGSADATAALVCAAGIADGEGGPSGSLYITGDVSATAIATSQYYNSADAFTGLFAWDDLTIRGADPLAYAPTAPGAVHARVQQKTSGFDEAYGIDGAEGHYTAELVIGVEEGTVSIEPKPVVAAPEAVEDNEHEVVSSLETRELRLIEPLGPGKDPLRFDLDGLALWATGAGVTAPSEGSTLTPDIEEAIARGIDPTTVLPAPAAGGGMGLSSGVDAYSVGGPDFCDQVVSGYCLPQEGKKKTE